MTFVKRFFATEYMLKPEQRRGEIPPSKTAYRSTLRIALPSVAEYFLFALVSIADTIMVSAVGEAAIAAVGITIQPRFVIQAANLALNIAVTSIVARRRGENDPEGAGRCLRQALVISMALSIVTASIGLVISRPFLMFTGAQADTIAPAMDYFRVMMYGLPVSSLMLAICAAQRGVGETRISMISNMTANLVNVAFNFLVIEGRFGMPRLEDKGAAIASVIGWCCGLLVALKSVLHRERFLTVLSRTGWLPDLETVRSMFKVASGSFVELVCMRFGFLLYTRVIAGLGTLMLAANTIGMNLMMLSFSVGEGLGVTASALTGQNLGAKRPDLSVLYYKVCQRLAYVASTGVLIIFWLGGGWMFSLFSSDPVVLEAGRGLMIMAGFITFGQASQLVFMGSLRGAGDTKFTAIISMISILLIRPAVAWVIAYPLALGVVGAWTGFLVDQYLRTVLTWFRLRSGKWMAIEL